MGRIVTKTRKTLLFWSRLRLWCYGRSLFLVSELTDKSLHPQHQSLWDYTQVKRKTSRCRAKKPRLVQPLITVRSCFLGFSDWKFVCLYRHGVIAAGNWWKCTSDQMDGDSNTSTQVLNFQEGFCRFWLRDVRCMRYDVRCDSQAPSRWAIIGVRISTWRQLYSYTVLKFS